MLLQYIIKIYLYKYNFYFISLMSVSKCRAKISTTVLKIYSDEWCLNYKYAGFSTPQFGNHSESATALAGRSVKSSRGNNSSSFSRMNLHAANKIKWDSTGGVTDWCIPLRGQPTVPTVTEQHGITGVVAVFHRQAAGPVQPTLSQGSGHNISGAWDTEAQLRGVSPTPWPHGEQASFTVINKRDVDWARVDQGVLAWVHGVGKVCICGNGRGDAADGFNWSILKRWFNFIHYCQTMENKTCEKAWINIPKLVSNYYLVTIVLKGFATLVF